MIEIKLNIILLKEGGDNLKIDINIDENIKDLYVAISYNKLTPEIEKIIATLRMIDKQLTVTKENEIFLLDISKVIYIESIERKCFVYTKDHVYESNFKLYELEQQLQACNFIRISKSCVINLKAIKSLKSDLNRRILITLNNNEQIIASRQYAEELKKMLGVK